jgi:hypothetical protein
MEHVEVLTELLSHHFLQEDWFYVINEIMVLMILYDEMETIIGSVMVSMDDLLHRVVEREQ